MFAAGTPLTRLFQFAYVGCVVTLTGWSFLGRAPLVNEQWRSVLGRGSFWLFAPDPSKKYLQMTACWGSPSAADASRTRCEGRPVFTSYAGALDSVLEPGIARPTRTFRLAEQLLELRARRDLHDAFAQHLMQTSAASAPPGACFRVIAHEAKLTTKPPVQFSSWVLWEKCR